MPKKLPDKLVLDTNIIVSAALNAKFYEIIAFKALYKIEVYTCAKQIAELERTFIKLAANLNAAPEHYTRLFEQLANRVEIDERFDRSPDPKDNYLFDLAYKVKSYYLVTGERALLNMKQVNQIKVISITDLRKILKDIIQ
jgi:putative PIN family toxin of toxin-antitoxin system